MNKKADKYRIIRSYLVRKGISNKEIAEATGFDTTYVCHILAGRKKNQKIQHYIADILDKSYKRLWGEAA